MRFVNLTPHVVTILATKAADSERATLAPSGTIARCAEVPTDAGSFALPADSGGQGEISVRLTTVAYGAVTGLPEPEAGTLYITSAMVRAAVPDRHDVASPGALVRGTDGQPIGCHGLVVNYPIAPQRIAVTADSHTDHDMSEAQLRWALDQAPPPCPFFIREVTLPESLGTVPSALRGPVAGDPPIGAADVTYATRGNRTGLSRMTALPPIASRKMTIIGGMHEGAYILFTAHGGPNAPREVFECERLYDKGEMTLDALSDARNFWAMHALSAGAI